ncbi:T9SS C-terminal target domain-containing protein [Flavobacterium arcticum]|uniref:T9SS C-terminal target domain-containing protein n=1 Tax=Flavobacterium arcticum TaxID=1784713 RepID=A0A345HB60_9FLAO|nr:PQQ-dependent sugar dehydrogenase [Flavobacterium arcticum]AXG73820.1 T9SS C-terminal target domain-containing protein [Flavobacterium arcticum]KAF2511772.1 T9SS type A sorting domain-containing protein [Flavobacterium arcticum]
MKTKLLFILTMLSSLAFGQTVDLDLFASGFNSPTEIVNAGDDRLFVVEQGGLIKVLNADGTTNVTPFLNVSSILGLGSERGLLGLAFHPDYATNGFFYVNYTNTSGDTVIARYAVSESDENIADTGSATILLTVDQPFSNHNGGCIHFGPDEYLYISMGDGGSGGDPNGNGQNKNTLLGAMLRIDVDGAAPYGIPADNPFVGVDGADEVWAYGLRNAWKFSFNKDNNDLWIADVGQGEIEEINKVDPSTGGYNFGWRCYEGSTEYNSDGCSMTETFTYPVAEYTHTATGGCSITGGYVYTGDTYPGLQGMYLFADYCNNKIGVLNGDMEITYTSAFSGEFFTTFGEDINGELYIAGSNSGNVYRIIDTELSTPTFTGDSFSVYPNPVTDLLTIEAANNIIATDAIIYDMSGKRLLHYSLDATEQNTFSIGTLPSGLYLLQITDVNGAGYNYKLAVK